MVSPGRRVFCCAGSAACRSGASRPGVGYNPAVVTTDQFRQLALEEMDAVYRMAFHLARDPDEAADLTQETFLRALRAEDTFVLGERGIRPWLFKILHNVFYTRIGRARRAPVATDGLGESAAASDAAGSDGAEPGSDGPAWDLASLNWDSVDDRLKHAIEELPDKYRCVLLLWAVEGLKYREVADVLEVPIGTVMSRLYRARSILSQKLSDLAAEHRIGVK